MSKTKIKGIPECEYVKVMPVAAVEIEVSLQSYEQKTKDGRQRPSSRCVFSREKPDAFDSVIATCKELSIPIIAYSYVLVILFSASRSPQTAHLVADYSPARSRTRRTCLKATLGECSVASKMRYATLLDFGSPADTTHSNRPLRITASLWIP